MDRAGGEFACVGWVKWASWVLAHCAGLASHPCLFSGALRVGLFGKYGGGDEEPWQQSHYCAAGAHALWLCKGVSQGALGHKSMSSWQHMHSSAQQAIAGLFC